MAEAWRVLEDEPGPADPAAAVATTGAGDATAPPTGDGRSVAEGRPVWLILAAGLAVVLGAIAWLVGPGTSDGAVAVSAARPPKASVVAVGSYSGSARALASPGAAASATETLVVDVDGAVRKPGVYRLPAGARMADAIRAAGGYGARVDAAMATQLNLAARVEDGQQVHVPARGERETAHGTVVDRGTNTGAAGATPATGRPVDINSATSAELEALPGIGPATATKIIAARASSRFASVEELRDRKVVGQATLEKIRNLVVVR